MSSCAALFSSGWRAQTGATRLVPLEILPTYRVITPEFCAMSEKVEAAGIEPAQDLTEVLVYRAVPLKTWVVATRTPV